MTDYHYMAEQIYTESRPPGSYFWLELEPAERDQWANVARAAERFIEPPEPEEFYCDDCYGHERRIDDLEEELDHRDDRIEELEKELAEYREAS